MSEKCIKCGSEELVRITPARPGPDGWGWRCKACGHRWDVMVPKADYNMELISDRAGETESGKKVPAGTCVEYLYHVFPGYAVKVVLPDGSEEVMSPACFEELR